VIQGYIDRIKAAFDLLRQQLEAYQPEALIVVGDDQGTCSTPATIRTLPSIRARSCGAGWHELSAAGRAPQSDFPCHAELARAIHKGLIKKGF
jgi:hypothetical protein